MNMQVNVDLLVKYVTGIWCPVLSTELMHNGSRQIFKIY